MFAQPNGVANDRLVMADVTDLTLDVLVKIREGISDLANEVRGTNARLDHLTERVERVESRLDTLTQYTVQGFATIDRHLDALLRITGDHHTQLESRVTRLEQHLKLG